MQEMHYIVSAAKPANPETYNPVCVVEEYKDGAKEMHVTDSGYDIVTHDGANIFIFLSKDGNVNNGANNISTWLSINRNAREAKKSKIPVYASYCISANRIFRHSRTAGAFELEWYPQFYKDLDNEKGFYFGDNIAPELGTVSICDILANVQTHWIYGDRDLGTERCPQMTAEHMHSQLINVIKKQVLPVINSGVERDVQADADTNASTNALMSWLRCTENGYLTTTVRKALFGPTHTVKPNATDRGLFSKFSYVESEELLLFKDGEQVFELPYFNGKFNISNAAMEAIRSDFDVKMERCLKTADAIIDKFYASVSKGLTPIETMEEALEKALPSFLQASAMLAIDRYKSGKDDPWTVSKAYLEIDWDANHSAYNFYSHGISIVQKYAPRLATPTKAYSNTDPNAHHYVPLIENPDYNPIISPSIQDSSLAKWCTMHTLCKLDCMFLGAWLYKSVKENSGGRQVLWLVNPGNCGTSTFVNYIYRSVDGSGAIYTRDETESGFFGQSIMGKKICAFVDIHSRPMNLLRNILNFTEAEVLTTNVKNRNFATFTARGLKVMVATNEKLSFDEELAWATSRVFPLQVKRADGQSIAMGDVIQRLLSTQEANLKWAAECYKHLEYYGYISGNDFTRVGANEYEIRVQAGIKVNPPEYDTTEDQSREQANANMEAVDDRFINFYAREVKEDLECLRRRAWNAVKDKLPKVLGVTYVNGRILADCLLAHDAMCSDGYDALEGFFEKIQKGTREDAIKEAQTILALVKESTWVQKRVFADSRQELKDLMPVRSRFYAIK